MNSTDTSNPGFNSNPYPKAYIFLNGDFVKPHNWPLQPAPEDLVVAADGGGRHLEGLGWAPHCLVGDFDSLDPELLSYFETLGAEIIRHPACKDEIDFELALGLVRQRGYQHIEVLGAMGGRWDMTFANILLPRADWGGDSIIFHHGSWTFRVVTGPATIEILGQKGDLLSLIPLGVDVTKITLEGCCYPLNGETLKAGLSRGLSNELCKPVVGLSFESGTLLVTHQAETSR